MVKCDKCDGTGIIPIYMHVQNGVCFKCGGSGSIPESKLYNRGYIIARDIAGMCDFSNHKPVKPGDFDEEVHNLCNCGAELPEGENECVDCAAEWRDYLDNAMDELSMRAGL